MVAFNVREIDKEMHTKEVEEAACVSLITIPRWHLDEPTARQQMASFTASPKVSILGFDI